VVVTYAEAGAWGRALVLETRRRGIRSVGLQHGFIYRHWLNYLHAPDEMQPSPANPADCGFPCPTLTLLYDDVAARHLRTAGGFPADRLAITGSARLDSLVAQARRLSSGDVERVREAVGAHVHQHLVVVAAKFTQIERVFPALVAAAVTMPDVRLVVKCHPAERATPYLAMAADAANVIVAPPSIDLASLTRSARLLVTVNSTAALEAMVMGVPSLVLALPNNLSPFVDAGVMAGVAEREAIAPVLRQMLVDETRRAALALRCAGFLAEFSIASDGRAAERAAERILG
jgi:UDP-N-acetylglucosamine 2-epimerase